MAFPTSPSNNQVHAEGNRKWVYDSALGVWDRVSAPDASLTPYGLERQKLDNDSVLQREYQHEGGRVIQVQSTRFRGTFHHAGNGHHTPEEWIDIGDLYCDIYPTFKNSSFLIMTSIFHHSDNNSFCNIKRDVCDGTDTVIDRAYLGGGGEPASKQPCIAGDGRSGENQYHANTWSPHLVDRPNIVPDGAKYIRYRVVTMIHSTANVKINHTLANNNASWQPSAQSTITVMEIAGADFSDKHKDNA